VTEFLYSIDVAIFHFLNGTIANPAGDFLWPLITDYDRFLAVRILLLCTWVLLIVKGGARGRTAALMVIPVLFLADQLSSSVIKMLVARPRPCHEVAGVPVVQGIHMLVTCGPGLSFPSSHAVNNFAVATLFSSYYRKWRWAFYAWASLVALSRPAVGVHYPSDILGGALIGVAVALAVVFSWNALCRRYLPRIAVTPAGAPPP